MIYFVALAQQADAFGLERNGSRLFPLLSFLENDLRYDTEENRRKY